MATFKSNYNLGDIIKYRKPSGDDYTEKANNGRIYLGEITAIIFMSGGDPRYTIANGNEVTDEVTEGLIVSQPTHITRPRKEKKEESETFPS